MKSFASSDIRNVALLGHGGSGKTMLSESMLACGGVINRLGSIRAGTTTSDYREEEKKHQISLHATLLHTEWDGKKINLIDCPGYLDFISEGMAALRVVDLALVVINAASGIEIGTDLAWENAVNNKVPRILVMNQLDREHTDFDEILAQAREQFGRQVFPMTLPMNPGPGFNQLLDVLRNDCVTYAADGTGKTEEKPAEGEWETKVKDLHRELIELIAESDDSLMEKFFENEGLTEEELRSGVHAAFQQQAVIPLFTVSAEHNIGAARLLDFISKYGSSPEDHSEQDALDADDNEIKVMLDQADPVAFVFKTASEAHVGNISLFRVFAGSVKAGTEIYNPSTNATEKLTQLYMLNGKKRDSVAEVGPGDIAAAVKLRSTHTGNTLCKPQKPARIRPVDPPEANIHAALILKNKGDEDRLAEGLSSLHEEDPAFTHRYDGETRQTVLSGQGDLHLQIISEELKARYNVEIEMIEPRVPFRETVRSKGDAKYRHKKQTGGAGQFAEVWMKVEPGERNTGVDFSHSLVGNNVDRVFVPSVEKGVRAASTEGILAGYPVVDVKVDFYDGKTHPVDSKDVAFQIAGKSAFQESFREAQPYLLEPIFEVEIRVPDSCTGDVVGDLSSRRGRVTGMNTSGRVQIISAQVPQVELYRYTSILRAITAGRGLHRERFSHYEEMPSNMQEKVAAQAKKNKESEK